MLTFGLTRMRHVLVAFAGRRPSRGGQALQGSVAPWLQRLNVHVVQQVATKHTQFRLEGPRRVPGSTFASVNVRMSSCRMRRLMTLT